MSVVARKALMTRHRALNMKGAVPLSFSFRCKILKKLMHCQCHKCGTTSEIEKESRRI